MQATIVDPRNTTPEEHAEYVRQAQVVFKMNHTAVVAAGAMVTKDVAPD